eukprot:GHVT01008406.1.p1 GENE.GHVT01008406.1~~GHVT01008406.1.p1  ORF type:complete len:356 (+),score=84.88 GHVT01008406.1:536-1603(+)
MCSANNFTIGCVGKPSAGKSTFFNAATEAQNAAVGNYPFTTIGPNQGVAHVTVACPCVRVGALPCRPRFGSCQGGRRRVPVKLLDVAGLIPGASEGRGLGNKFLDDLRQADVLIHVIDVSGNTNEKGEATIGYDPVRDHAWLVEEVVLWIFNNVWSRWMQVARRHDATGSSIVATLARQLSGYGANERAMQRLCDSQGLKDPVDLKPWDKEKLTKLISDFVQQRFHFVLLLNKADQGGETNQNAMKITEMVASSGRPQEDVILSSSLAECFLRKMRDQHYISYEEGGSSFIVAGEEEQQEKKLQTKLKPMDDKIAKRLENIKDLVLFRYGSTGVQRVRRIYRKLKQRKTHSLPLF